MKKTTLIPLLFLVIGLCIGYFFAKKNSTSNFDDEKASFLEKLRNESLKFYGPDTSRVIPEEEAKKLIESFRKENAGNSIPMQTVGGENLNGFYIERKHIDTILSDKSNSGISFYFAKHPHAQNNRKSTYTLIYIAAKKISSKAADKQTDTIINNGPAYDYIDPCPKACGSLAP